MDQLLDITYVYLFVLTLALLVERIMEVLMDVWGYIEWKTNGYKRWNRRAEKIRRKFEIRAGSRLLVDAASLAGLARRVRTYTDTDEAMPPGNTIIISGKAVRRAFVATASRIVASILGIVVCTVAGINFVAVIGQELALDTPLLAGVPVWLQIALSGIIIGLGSEPVHHMITNLERRREDRARRARQEKAKLESAEKRG